MVPTDGSDGRFRRTVPTGGSDGGTVCRNRASSAGTSADLEGPPYRCSLSVDNFPKIKSQPEQHWAVGGPRRTVGRIHWTRPAAIEEARPRCGGRRAEPRAKRTEAMKSQRAPLRGSRSSVCSEGGRSPHVFGRPARCASKDSERSELCRRTRASAAPRSRLLARVAMYFPEHCLPT
jgi:hypothetical protein